MTPLYPNTLARSLRQFFSDYLPAIRGLSPHTIQSYRDTVVLLLRFVAQAKQLDPVRLELTDLLPEDVLAGGVPNELISDSDSSPICKAIDE